MFNRMLEFAVAVGYGHRAKYISHSADVGVVK